MKQIQTLVLVLVAFSAAGCATRYARSELTTPYSESVTEHRVTGYGDVVDVQKTNITAPGYGSYGAGAYGYGLAGIPFLQPASLGEQAVGQLPQGTSYIVPMAVQPQSTPPAQASEAASDDIAVLAEAQLRMQRELDEMKKNKNK